MRNSSRIAGLLITGLFFQMQSSAIVLAQTVPFNSASAGSSAQHAWHIGQGLGSSSLGGGASSGSKSNAGWAHYGSSGNSGSGSGSSRTFTSLKNGGSTSSSSSSNNSRLSNNFGSSKSGASSSNTPVVVSSGTQVLYAGKINGDSSISVASGATAIIEFGRRSSVLDILGDIVNSGSIYAVSTNAALKNVSINALDIINNSGAVLSTTVPAGLISGNRISNNAQNLSLSLSAANTIVNAGTVSSAGPLSLIAGNAITNSGVINAEQNVRIIPGGAGLRNSGLISSTTGNINISNMANQSLLINNTSGTLQASLGNVNLSAFDAASDQLNISLMGGNVDSQALNLNALNGSADVDVDQLQGTVNISAASTHITASTTDLKLGALNVSGDPTFYNLSGNVTLESDLNFTPTNFVTGPVNLAIIASGDIDAANSVTLISTSTIPNSNNVPPGTAYPGDTIAGDILLVAGANFTASPNNSPTPTTQPVAPPPVQPGPNPPTGDTTSTLTIVAPAGGAAGGSINLPGVNISTQAGETTATASASGNVTLIAYGGTGSHSGSITVGNITTGEYNVPANDNSGLNGNVTIIGTGAVNAGSINTGGNSINPTLNSGNILIASAQIQMLQLPVTGQNTLPFTTTSLQEPVSAIYGGYNNTAGIPGNTVLTLNSSTGIGTGMTLYLDPQGPDYEQVTVSSISGNQITLNSPLALYHYATEAVYVGATQIVINPGAGTPGAVPTVQNGGIFAPGTLGTGTVTIAGQISGSGAVTIETGGAVQINSSIGLSMNPTTCTTCGAFAPNYFRLPTVSVTGDSVTVASGVVVSSAISGCTLCPSSTNITTNSLVNSGTIGSSTGGNMMVTISSAAGLTAGGGNISVPTGSVIELSAADQNILALSPISFSTGAASLVVLDAQGSNGSISISGTLTFSGGPIISINTPGLNPGSGAVLNATSATSSFLIGSGYSGAALTITINNSFTISGAPVSIHPFNGYNLVLAGSGSLEFPNSAALLQTSGTAVIVNGGIALTGSQVYPLNNPSGDIQGIAFQPYVGGLASSTSSNFVQFAAYPYQVVLDLLGNLLATTDTSNGVTVVSQQFQSVSTYTQVSSSGYVIQAAKQLGLLVSAGVYAMINTDGSITQSNYNTYQYDAQAALAGAKIYGNVENIVVGNEDIVAAAGTTNASASIATLETLIAGGTVTIQFVGPTIVPSLKTLRSATVNPLTGTDFSSSTLPITTRQQAGVLNLVTDPTNGSAMTALMNTCEQYVYGNYYPFFDESLPNGVVATLESNPNISQSAFTTLVDGYMTNLFDTNATNFQTAGITSTTIRVGETGWATPLSSGQNLPAYEGIGLPQQNLTWAQWYYQAMEGWSMTTVNPLTHGTGVVIGGYFESINEPWKGIIGGNPNGTAVLLGTAVSSGSTTVPTNSANAAAFYVPSTLTPMSIVINPQGNNPAGTTEEVQNYYGSQPTGSDNGLSVSSTNFISSLVNSHSSTETIVAGSPQEPFFGLFAAVGNSTPNGTTFQLTSMTQQYPIVPYRLVIKSSQSVSQGSPSQSNTTLLSLPATAPVASSLPGLSLAFFDSNLPLSAGGSTIIPTDVNPQLRADNEADTAETPPIDSNNSNNSNNQDGLASTQGTQQLAGYLPYIAPQFGLNPADSLITFTGHDLLLAPDHDVTVKTDLAKVEVDAGTAVMLRQTDRGEAIYLLHDDHNGAARVTVEGQTMQIPMGRQLLLTHNHSESFDNLNKSSIGYRNLKDGKLGSLRAFMSEFSLPTALSTSTIRQLLKSSDRNEQLLAGKLLKTAAAMSIIDKGNTPFKASH